MINISALCVSSPLEGTSDDGPEYPCDSYSDSSLYGPDGLPTFRPLIIGHRGASGMFPEHTALAYREAAKQGQNILLQYITTKLNEVSIIEVKGLYRGGEI